MKFSIKKLRTVFSDAITTESSLSDTYIDDIIDDVEGHPFAISESNVMYAGTSELAGYHYLNTIIIGTLNVKTFKGAKLLVSGHDLELNLTSDMLELKSESASTNRNVTRIDFEIDKKNVSKISRKSVKNLRLITQKSKLIFTIVEANADEEE